jgi:hypothetical protein
MKALTMKYTQNGGQSVVGPEAWFSRENATDQDYGQPATTSN